MHFEAMIYCFNSPDAKIESFRRQSQGKINILTPIPPHFPQCSTSVVNKFLTIFYWNWFWEIGVGSVDRPIICNNSAHNRKADLVARLLEEERLKKKRKRDRAPQEVVQDVEAREIPTRKGNPRHACNTRRVE